MWKPGPEAANAVVGVGDGEGVGDCSDATLLPVWFGGAQAEMANKKAAGAANHFPFAKSLRTERDAQCMALQRDFS